MITYEDELLGYLINQLYLYLDEGEESLKNFLRTFTTEDLYEENKESFDKFIENITVNDDIFIDYIYKYPSDFDLVLDFFKDNLVEDMFDMHNTMYPKEQFYNYYIANDDDGIVFWSNKDYKKQNRDVFERIVNHFSTNYDYEDLSFERNADHIVLNFKYDSIYIYCISEDIYNNIDNICNYEAMNAEAYKFVRKYLDDNIMEFLLKEYEDEDGYETCCLDDYYLLDALDLFKKYLEHKDTDVFKSFHYYYTNLWYAFSEYIECEQLLNEKSADYNLFKSICNFIKDGCLLDKYLFYKKYKAYCNEIASKYFK